MSVASEAAEAATKAAPGFWSRLAGHTQNATGKAREIGGRVATHVGEHKVPYSLLGAGAVATVAYNAGGNHRERLMNRAQSQGQAQER